MHLFGLHFPAALYGCLFAFVLSLRRYFRSWSSSFRTWFCFSICFACAAPPRKRQTNETERKRLPNPTTIDRPHRSTSNEEVSTGFQSSVALPKYTYIQKRNEYNSCALSRLSIATLQRALSWINERVEVNRTALISDL